MPKPKSKTLVKTKILHRDLTEERRSFYSVLRQHFLTPHAGFERAVVLGRGELLEEARKDDVYRKKLLAYGDELAVGRTGARGRRNFLVAEWENFKVALNQKIGLSPFQKQLDEVARLVKEAPGYDRKNEPFRGRKGIDRARRSSYDKRKSLDVTNKKDVQKTDKQPKEGETMAQAEVKPEFDKAAITTELMAVLKEARLEAGLSQSGLAMKSGVSLSDIRKLESPNSQFNAPAWKFDQLADALGYKLILAKN